MKVIDIFRVALEMELRGMEFYTSQCSIVKLPLIKEIFEHLALMEKGHAEYIRAQIDKIGLGERIETPFADNSDNLFLERLASQKIDTSSLKSDLGDYSVVRMAYLIEKDFASFYAEGQNDAVMKKTLEMLAAWERGHAEMLKTQLEGIIERNALDLGFYPF